MSTDRRNPQEPIFSVVALDPPVERKGKLYHWGCRNRLSGRIWRQSYRITRDGAEGACRTLNIEAELYAASPGACSILPPSLQRSSRTVH